MKRLLSLALLGLAATTLACDQQASVTDLELTPSFAKIWAHKVNGGGELLASNSGDKTLYEQVSVTDFGVGSAKGVIGQVERYLVKQDGTTQHKWHGVVTGFMTEDLGGGVTLVNICGVITTIQEEGSSSGGWPAVDSPFGIAIKDIPGGPDLEKHDWRNIDCTELYDFDPGANGSSVMVDGNFRVM